MILVVYDNVLIPFVDELYEAFPESSRGYVSRKDRIADVLAHFGKPPLFTDGWLLKCATSVSVSTLKAIEEVMPKNRIVLLASSAEQYEELCKKLQEMNPTCIDNHKLEKEEILSWIIAELKCSRVVSEKIYNRTKGHLLSVMSAVKTLGMLDHVTENDVITYVEKSQGIFLNDVVEWILHCPRRGVKFQNISSFIYDFRYAQSWVLNSLSKGFDEYLVVFQMISSGELSLKNYRTIDDKRLKSIPRYKLKRIIQSFGYVSTEYVFLVKALVDEIPRHDSLGIFKLLQVIKLGGTE